MRYSGILQEDIVNGTGCRVSIFICGCDNKCPGCFNKELWDFNYGKKFSNFTFNDIVKYIRNPLISGITLLGGDPLHKNNVPDVLKFILRYKKYVNKHKDDGCDGKDNIWIYSGYTFEELINRDDNNQTLDILKNSDVLVDGRFIEELKDSTLLFRGSSNQRVIDLKETFKSPSNNVVLIDFFEDDKKKEKIIDDDFINKSYTSPNIIEENNNKYQSKNNKNSFTKIRNIIEKCVEKIINLVK